MVRNQKAAWKFYSQWMRGKTYSPALKSEIKITRKGWDHIIDGTNAKRRFASDKVNKLNLLKAAKHIISNVKEYKTSYRNNVKYITIEGKAKIKIKGKLQDKEIKVLIKEDKQKNKYFYSVMRA